MRFLVEILIIIAATSTTSHVIGIDVIANDVTTRGSCAATDADGSCVDDAYPSVVVPPSDDEISAGGGGVFGVDGGEEDEEEYEDEEEDEEDEDEEAWVKNPSVSIHRQNPACADKDEKCASYASSGACASNPGYMTHNCASSCGTCDMVIHAAKVAEFAVDADKDVVARPCTDDEYECVEWAGMGECENNPR